MRYTYIHHLFSFTKRRVVLYIVTCYVFCHVTPRHLSNG